LGAEHAALNVSTQLGILRQRILNFPQDLANGAGSDALLADVPHLRSLGG
jgi:hypothetical protein